MTFGVGHQTSHLPEFGVGVELAPREPERLVWGDRLAGDLVEGAQTASVDDLLAHVGWVQALARSLVRDSAAADDLAQETWMAALTGTRITDINAFSF